MILRRVFNRRSLYYVIAAIMGGSIIAALLNSQFVLVAANPPGRPVLPWELILSGWGSLVYSIGCLTLASLSDRFGRMRCISWSAGAIGLLNALMGSRILGPYQVWHFLVFWGVMNLGISIFFTAIEGLLSDYQDHKAPLTHRLGAYCLAWCIGDATAAFFTGYTKQGYGPELVHQVIAVICLLSAAAVMIDSRRFGDYSHKGLDASGPPETHDLAPFHAILARIGLFFASLSYSAILAAFPRFGRDFHAFSEGQIGKLLSIIMTFSFLTFLLLSLWQRWRFNLRLQILFQFPMIVGLILGLAAPPRTMTILVIGFILFGIGWAACYFFSIYYSLLVPENHARSGGVHEASMGLGNVVGPLAAIGLMGAIVGRNLVSPNRIGAAAFVVGLLALLTSLTLQLHYIHRNRPSRPSTQS